MGIPLTVESTGDRRHSMDDADFVVNTALVTGHGRLRDGWEIARNAVTGMAAVSTSCTMSRFG